MMSEVAIEPVGMDVEHVTHDDCRRRCRTTQWLIGTILAGIVASIAGVAIVWGSTVGAATECKEATATFREHQAVSGERKEAVEKRLDRIEDKIDGIIERLP